MNYALIRCCHESQYNITFKNTTEQNSFVALKRNNRNPCEGIDLKNAEYKVQEPKKFF